MWHVAYLEAVAHRLGAVVLRRGGIQHDGEAHAAASAAGCARIVQIWQLLGIATLWRPVDGLVQRALLHRLKAHIVRVVAQQVERIQRIERTAESVVCEYRLEDHGAELLAGPETAVEQHLVARLCHLHQQRPEVLVGARVGDSLVVALAAQAHQQRVVAARAVARQEAQLMWYFYAPKSMLTLFPLSPPQCLPWDALDATAQRLIEIANGDGRKGHIAG